MMDPLCAFTGVHHRQFEKGTDWRNMLTNELTWWDLTKLKWDFCAGRELEGVRASKGVRTCCTNLYAYQIWESERHIQLILEVLRHRHSFSISDLEC